MPELPAPLEKLASALVRLPGIGRRSAQRLAFHLARRSAVENAALAHAIEELSESLRRCEICGHMSSDAQCEICQDARRDDRLLCVVEQPENLFAIERTGVYRGRYHVLGGAISPLRGIGPEDLGIDRLLARIDASEVDELVVATNPTMEGEATAIYIARRLAGRSLTVSRLATGLPVGGDLDFVDRSTLSRALEGRRRLGLGDADS